jgi:hypothetical protein
MGNEFGAADLQPHLAMGLVLIKKIDTSAAATHTVVSGGYHQKMRLRQAYVLTVDAVYEAAHSPVLTVLHGANIAATVTGGADPVGHCNTLAIVDQYKDVDPDEGIFVTTDGDTATGDSLFMLEYELVE